MATAPPHVGALRARLFAAGSWWLSWSGLLLLALLYSHGMMTEGTSAHPVHPALTQMSAAAHSTAGHGSGLPAASATKPATDPAPGSVPGSAPGSVSGAGPGSASGAQDLAAGPRPGPLSAGQGASPAPHNGHDVSHAAQDCLSGAVKDATDLPALCAAPDRAAPPSYVPGWAVVRLTAHAAGPLPPSAPPTLRI
ncbi:hypothetical protein SMD11_3204 [Streptomyces albireticuli]|uniref:Uncharacterized protein n=1 Tax=Streptomyces albireticuli TaxID=1940 RepID=A0A1Z2L3H5_9ACTN|nr:hypothetical protein [Streptomyces albireticuli]ARZ68845.1 hypothetical protein SMD11_3204 [Streptomyces albireticuli]